MSRDALGKHSFHQEVQLKLKETVLKVSGLRSVPLKSQSLTSAP